MALWFSIWGAVSFYTLLMLIYHYRDAKPYGTKDFGFCEWGIITILAVVFPVGILAVNEVMAANEKDSL